MMKYLVGAGMMTCSVLLGGPALAGEGGMQWLCSAGDVAAGTMVMKDNSYSFIESGIQGETPVAYQRQEQTGGFNGTLTQRPLPGGAVIEIGSGPLLTRYGLTSGYLNANATQPTLAFGDTGELLCRPD